MSAFLTPLIVSPYPSTALPDGVNWLLEDDLTYQSSIAGMITVPKGFITDFASTPSLFWTTFPPWGRYGPGSVIHDWLYWMQMFDRHTADCVLYEAMIVCKTDQVIANLIYDMLRQFGQAAWDGDLKTRTAGLLHVAPV